MQLSHPLQGKSMAETGRAKWRLLNPVLVHFNATIVNNIWFKKMKSSGHMFNPLAAGTIGVI